MRLLVQFPFQFDFSVDMHPAVATAELPKPASATLIELGPPPCKEHSGDAVLRYQECSDTIGISTARLMPSCRTLRLSSGAPADTSAGRSWGM